MEHKITEALCAHCWQPCELTTGREIYPHRADLHDKNIYICRACDARVGCHGDSKQPLGTAAKLALRRARQITHSILDPLWLNAPRHNEKRRDARRRVYDFLAAQMGCPVERCHVGMFNEAQCRRASQILRQETYFTIKQWAAQNAEGSA